MEKRLDAAANRFGELSKSVEDLADELRELRSAMIQAVAVAGEHLKRRQRLDAIKGYRAVISGERSHG